MLRDCKIHMCRLYHFECLSPSVQRKIPSNIEARLARIGACGSQNCDGNFRRGFRLGHSNDTGLCKAVGGIVARLDTSRYEGIVASINVVYRNDVVLSWHVVPELRADAHTAENLLIEQHATAVTRK